TLPSACWATANARSDPEPGTSVVTRPPCPNVGSRPPAVKSVRSSKRSTCNGGVPAPERAVLPGIGPERRPPVAPLPHERKEGNHMAIIPDGDGPAVQRRRHPPRRADRAPGWCEAGECFAPRQELTARSAEGAGQPQLVPLLVPTHDFPAKEDTKTDTRLTLIVHAEIDADTTLRASSILGVFCPRIQLDLLGHNTLPRLEIHIC